MAYSWQWVIVLRGQKWVAKSTTCWYETREEAELVAQLARVNIDYPDCCALELEILVDDQARYKSPSRGEQGSFDATP